MKKQLLLTVVLCALLTGCSQRDEEVSQKEIIEKYNVSEILLVESLNALDNSKDSISSYDFMRHNEKAEFTLVSEDFKEPLEANLTFDYAQKNNKVVLCFPPQVSMPVEGNMSTEVLDEWSYKLVDNTVYFTSRIAFEKKENHTIKRTIENVVLTVTL